MATFNLESTINEYANKIFEQKLSTFSANKYSFLKKLIKIYSDNLVSIYLNKDNKLNTWKSSNVEIPIEDFDKFQHSLTDEFIDMFTKIENKLFSVKQINSLGDAVNINLELDPQIEHKYNSLKKAICFYIMN